jgi:cytoskeleton protein RodZ
VTDAVASGESVPVPTDAGPGSKLLAERRRQGLSLGDVSRQLKLSVRQVEAIERDDFSQYKGAVFVHGFLRNYAKLLGMDPEPLIRSADAMISPPAPDALARGIEAEVALEEPSGRRGSTIVVVAILAVLAIGLFYAGMKRRPPSAPVDKSAPVAQVQESPPARTVLAEKKPEAASKVEPKPEAVARATVSAVSKGSPEPAPASEGSANLLVLRMVFEQDSWVEVKDRNGKPVFGQLNPAGSHRTARGEPPLSIVIGNAAGVRLFKGEESIDLAPHTRVDVARLKLE